MKVEQVVKVKVHDAAIGVHRLTRARATRYPRYPRMSFILSLAIGPGPICQSKAVKNRQAPRGIDQIRPFIHAKLQIGKGKRV